MILIDTGIYVAYLNQRDQNHQRAQALIHRALSGEFGSRFTLSEVFSETATLLYRRTMNKKTVESAWNLFYSTEDAWAQPITIIREHINDAWAVFQSYVTPSRKLNFVDCLLIAVAQGSNIANILSFDKQFDGILTRID